MRLSFAHLCDRLSRLTFSGSEEGHWVTIGAEEGEDGEKHGGVPVFIKGDRIAKGPAKMVGHSPEHPTGGVPSPQPVLAPAIPQQSAAPPATQATPAQPAQSDVPDAAELVRNLGQFDTHTPTHSNIGYLRSGAWTATALHAWGRVKPEHIPQLMEEGILESAGPHLYRLGLPAHVVLDKLQSAIPGTPATAQQQAATQQAAPQAAAPKPPAAAKPKADKGAAKAKGKLKKIKKYTGTIAFGTGYSTNPQIKKGVENALLAMGLQEKDLSQVVALAVPDASLFPKVMVYAPAGSSVLYFSAENGDSHVQRHLYLNKGPDGKKYLVLKNDEFFLDKDLQGEGAGTTFFYNQVKNAAKLGVKRIETYGAKSSSMNGYYTWPRLGYDAPLGYYKDKLPASLKSAKMISDLMATQEGRDWWKKYGGGTNYTFDLTPGSFNHQVLDKYVAEKFG